MGRLRSRVLLLAIAILSLWSISGCGGGTKAGAPLFPGQVSLSPTGNVSVNLGSTFNFTASAHTVSNVPLAVPITYTSTDTSVLNVAPNGVACAGHWDVAFSVCTPGGTGVVKVTASALGESSVPTYIFVHEPIDNITVTGVLLTGVPVQEPCLSQSQSMTVEAHAFSQGSDITSSVGPFTWSADNLSVVNLIPLVNIAYNFPTNQATAKALMPGMAQIYASASGVTSNSFQQAQYQNSQGTSPILDFFETCPIQNITLEVGAAGSQQTTQTTFVASKGTTVNATAVLTDVMGNSSLPNTYNGIVLSKVPLTWSASRPAVLGAPNGCLQSCALSAPLAGSGSITASCTPPTCNIGFPRIPASLSTPAAIATCTQFFKTQSGAPPNFGCEELIPVPVYSTPLQLTPAVVGNGAISGLITGLPASASVLATSTGCAHLPPATCTTSLYSFSTGKGSTGPANAINTSPNSLLFDPAGDRAFMGSDFGAQLVNPAGFGSGPFAGIGTVTGTALASSNNGSFAVFSDTLHTPNQVYIVNATTASAQSATALSIPQAVAAAFSPDGLKAFIFGNGGSSLYVYSALQALQGPGLQGPGSNPQLALSGPANANTVAFSPNGAFAYVAEAAANGGSANLTAFNTCDNQIAASPAPAPVPAVVDLPADPLFMRVLPGLHLEGTDSFGNTIPDGTHVLVLDATGVDIVTSTISPPTPGIICPQTLAFVSNPPSQAVHAQRVELGQGPLQPLNFFPSTDGTQLYVVAAGHASILVYDFSVGSVTSGIELLGNATPVSADISPDAATIVVAGSDGLLHEVSTGLGGSDQFQLSFPNIPDYLNPFCAITTPQNPCTLNLVAVRP